MDAGGVALSCGGDMVILTFGASPIPNPDPLEGMGEGA
jgi:hypothetical protein